LDCGLDVNVRGGSDGLTALAVAGVRDYIDVVRLLIDRHANVNLPDTGGHTPLLHVAMRGHTEAVRLLLKNGATVNTASKHG
jgi:ankyrin repeat protein